MIIPSDVKHYKQIHAKKVNYGNHINNGSGSEAHNTSYHKLFSK